MIRINRTLFLCCLFSCTSQSPKEEALTLNVAAASSLSAPMQAIGAAFEQENQNVKIRLNFAASSFLARQIEQHAPADVYVSANPEWTSYLAARGHIDSTTIVEIAKNQLVVIVPAGASTKPAQLSDLIKSDFQPIAVGDPSHVPVGVYSRQVLEKAGLWQQIKQSVLPTLEAAATLATVSRGETPVGIAYRSELYQRNDVGLAFVIPDSLQPNIIYTAAPIQASANQKFAKAFLSFMISKTGQKILSDYQLIPYADSMGDSLAFD